MKTKAVRLYGKGDLRLEELELPNIKENEILAKICTDSLCMSSYKAAMAGEDHKRVPNDIRENPIIIGHEFCGEIIKIGEKWLDKYKNVKKFVIQPALNYKGSLDAPGYSYRYIGGDATYVIIPNEVMEMDCLIPYNGEAFYKGSLAEPLSCVIGAFNASYHVKQGTYEHIMGTKKDGNMLFVGGCGAMGSVAVDYLLNAYENKPKKLVIFDLDDKKIEFSKKLFENCNKDVELVYINDPALVKKESSFGYDDIFVFAPNEELVEFADSLLNKDGCLNFFAGPEKTDFSSKINFYNVHYGFTHFVATSGGNSDDMRRAVSLIENNILDLSYLVTHVGGLDSVVHTTLNLPRIGGIKKLIYTGLSMPLIKISDLKDLSKSSELYEGLYESCNKNNGFWCEEAEKYLLSRI